VTRKLILSSC